jgi:heme-degrading monooxygenase HmoA
LAQQLAQLNIAFAREPLEAPLLADFRAALEPVNGRADLAPGFVWRMQTADGDSTGVRGFGDDPRLIINLTVWESIDALRAFVYDDPAHLAVMRRRREWFARLDLHTALWWVPIGHRPSVAEAEDRFARLAAEGPTSMAFSFNREFESPSATAGQVDHGRVRRS